MDGKLEAQPSRVLYHMTPLTSNSERGSKPMPPQKDKAVVARRLSEELHEGKFLFRLATKLQIPPLAGTSGKLPQAFNP